MSFRITGLDPAPFAPLYGLCDADLATRGVHRVRADAHPGYPDRVELRDAEPGETLLLLNHEHQPAPTPYRSTHAISVLEGATRPAVFVDEVPTALRRRPISLRAFDSAHEMVDADLADGEALGDPIERFLSDPTTAYFHAHYAKRGCYAALVERG
ncbi:MAG TPA: DUF1203 domain-containing protein [Sphingomonas sp.]